MTAHRILMKSHSYGGGLLLAACDRELLGRRFAEGVLRLEVSRPFYEGEAVEKRIFLEAMNLATVLNLVGKVTVGLAIEAGVVDPETVLHIQGVPHAQVVKVEATAV